MLTMFMTSLTILAHVLLEWWPALAKIGVDILSNAILSFAFLRVIFRQYKVFGNSLYKSLLSNGIIFS
jgi:hypothetical protein